ncbi:MAG: hypothetical protein AB1630_05150 [bacterium]
MKKIFSLLVLATIGYGADFPAPSQYGTIAAAISAANNGGTIEIQNVKCKTDVRIYKNARVIWVFCLFYFLWNLSFNPCLNKP